MQLNQKKRKHGFLLNFYIFFILVLLCTSCTQKNSEQSPAQNNSTLKSTAFTVPDGHAVTAYYFHTTYRCYSCTRIEELTRASIKNNFANEIKNKTIVFKTVNVEMPENRHFIQDYQLYTKTVVLVDMANGKQVKWKRLDETWNHLRDEEAFDQYIKDEIFSFITEAG